MPGNQRSMRSSLATPNVHSIQNGSLRYSWRGIPCIKNPFDFALYPLLLWQTKPGTIVEIGSNAGGSAVWLADLIRVYGLSTQVISIDLQQVKNVKDPKVRFLAGDAHDLGKTLTKKVLDALARPWLVIEDSSHQYATCLSVMNFFEPLLRRGEYLVIEDGIIDDLGGSNRYAGGPNKAIKEFLESRPGRFAIDTTFCDFFGHNMTWNTNGYLRKLV
jgi:cephalosporin hydroxylase